MRNITGFSAINEYKLNSEGRKLLEKIDRLFESDMIKKVDIISKDFDILLKAVIPSYRDDCNDIIPHQGKQIVRAKL